VRLVVLTPSRGAVSIAHRDSFAALAVACYERGVEFGVWDETCPGNLPLARAILLYRAATELEPGDVAWWQDSDVSLHPNLVLELVHRPELVIAKAYPLHTPQRIGAVQAWSVYPVQGPDGRPVLSEDRQLTQAAGFGFGAVMMKRMAAVRCLETFGTWGAAGRGKPACPVFLNYEGPRHKDIRMEDSGFCERWSQEVGEKLWLAPGGVVRNGELAGDFAKGQVGT
jgi:hypothetical protein